MNKYMEINELLDKVLGPEARAIWLCARVDEKPSYVIAREFNKSVGEINDILKTADFAVEEFIKLEPEPRKPPVKPAINGFHAIGDGE